MDLAGVMSFSRGDIVKCWSPRHDPNRGPKKRFALVLSHDEYNDEHDHGVMVAISTGVPNQPLPGVHQVKDWHAVGLDKESVVVPWLWTLEWDAVDVKTGVLSPYELGQVIDRLREVVAI